MAAQGSGGPGDHPGATVVPLTKDTTTTAALITNALTAGGVLLFKYVSSGTEFAVFVTGYKGL